MNIRSLKARVLRALKSSLPHAVVSASPPSPPAKPGSRVLHVDTASDDAFFDAHDAPKYPPPRPEPIDAWELVPATNNSNQESPGPDPLQEFPTRCPPRGGEAVVLYTTTLRGIRRTFEDCNKVRSLLENLTVAFQERDVSMDQGLRDELWGVLGEKAVPPRLFVRGRYVGGAGEVVALHEAGRLVPLFLRQSPAPAAAQEDDKKRAGKCEACGGLRFAVCGECHGSRRVFDGERAARCRRCNENGLVMCRLCSVCS